MIHEVAHSNSIVNELHYARGSHSEEYVARSIAQYQREVKHLRKLEIARNRAIAACNAYERKLTRQNY